METISIANRKGGIGKTTFAVNISNELTQAGHLVLMIDLDSQCDLSKIYCQGSGNQGDIMKLIQGECSLKEAVFKVKDNLHIIPGSEELIHLEDCEEDKLKEILAGDFFKEVDYVIIDHPPNINEAALQGFVASNEVLVVVEPEAFCVENINSLLDDLYHIQFTMNSDLQILGIAINRIDLRRNLTKSFIKKLDHTFKEEIFEARISNNTAVPTSLNERVPLRELEWRSKTVNQFQDLIKEMKERMVDNGDEQTQGE